MKKRAPGHFRRCRTLMLLASTAGFATGTGRQNQLFRWMAVGAALFFVSDMLLAMRAVSRDAAECDELVWLTYSPGQMLIVFGALAVCPRPVHGSAMARCAGIRDPRRAGAPGNEMQDTRSSSHRARLAVMQLIVCGGIGCGAVAVFVTAAVFVLHRELRDYSLRDIEQRLSLVVLGQARGALAAAATSYTLLTGYDWLAVHYIDRSLPYSRIGAGLVRQLRIELQLRAPS